MRVELNDDNSKKMQKGEDKLRAEQGIVTSPNEMVNMIIGALDMIELQEVISLTFRMKSSGGNQPPVVKKTVKKRIYVLDLK